jgi:hypothetical protein
MVVRVRCHYLAHDTLTPLQGEPPHGGTRYQRTDHLPAVSWGMILPRHWIECIYFDESVTPW